MQRTAPGRDGLGHPMSALVAAHPQSATNYLRHPVRVRGTHRTGSQAQPPPQGRRPGRQHPTVRAAWTQAADVSEAAVSPKACVRVPHRHRTTHPTTLPAPHCRTRDRLKRTNSALSPLAHPNDNNPSGVFSGTSHQRNMRRHPDLNIVRTSTTPCVPGRTTSVTPTPVNIANCRLVPDRTAPHKVSAGQAAGGKGRVEHVPASAAGAHKATCAAAASSGQIGRAHV